MSTEYFELMDKVIHVGLRQLSTNALNKPGLVSCLNLRPSEEGLRQVDTLDYPFASDRTEWPYPMLYQGKGCNLMLYADDIHSVNMTGNWTTTSLAHTGAINRWSIADFYEYVLLHNGKSYIAYNTITGIATRLTLGHSTPIMPLSCNTICNFKGQLLFGGIQSSWYDCDETFIAWSGIGTTTAIPDNTNEAGYTPLGVGEVYDIRQLGDALVVYASEGIYLLKPVNAPVPTFAKKKLLPIGSLGKYCSGGNEFGHIFLDINYDLWRIGPDLVPKRLYYNEFFLGMITGSMVIVPDSKKEGDYYISDGQVGYCLTEYGLCEIGKLPTSIYRTSDSIKAIYKDTGRNGCMLTTNQLDFGSRGRKFINSIEIGYSGKEPVLVAMEWRNRSTDEFKLTPWVRCNPAGYCTLPLEAVEIRFVVWSNTFAEFDLDYIRVGVKYSDKVFRRSHVSTTYR